MEDLTSFQSPDELKYFLKLLLYGDVAGDLTDFKVKNQHNTRYKCQIICNNSKSDWSVKRRLAKDGHEYIDSSQQHFHNNETNVSSVAKDRMAKDRMTKV